MKLKTRITIFVTVLVFALSLLIGTAGVQMNRKSSTEVLQNQFGERTSLAAEYIESSLDFYKNIVASMGMDKIFSSTSLDVAEKEAVMSQKAKTFGFVEGNITGADGKTILWGDAVDISSRDYFIRAMAGETCVSEPVLSKKTNTIIMLVAAPLYAGGDPNGKIQGVIFLQTDSILDPIMREFADTKTMESYIINSKGTVIAHIDSENVINGVNHIENAGADAKTAKIAAVEKKALESDGIEVVDIGKTSYVYAYNEIKNSDGWHIIINDLKDNYLGGAKQAQIISIGFTIFSIIAGIVGAIILSNNIAKPIEACSANLSKMSEGNMNLELLKVKGKDERALLINATNILITKLSGLIKGQSEIMSNMARGNLNVSCPEYAGDFKTLSDATNNVIEALNGTLKTIHVSASEVENGAGQIAAAAGTIAQGATEQASVVEELASTIASVNGRIGNSATMTEDAKNNVVTARKELEETSCRMNEMVESMNEINIKSEEISKVIGAIESIAFQTNILALNASVEAARAGEAGKGFSVVAEEVRNLAHKTTESAASTASLIAETLEAVKLGVSNVEKTAESLKTASDASAKAGDLMLDIASAAEENANSMKEIDEGINQIAEVVTMNSATSEECASSSQELSSHATNMLREVEVFKLK